MTGLVSPLLRPLLAPLAVSIGMARLPSGPAEPTYPAKSFYSEDFAGIANGTTLRSLSGWSAYNSASSTAAARDQWQVQSNAITRMNVSNDYAAAPGAFIIGRAAPSTNHIFKATLKTLPDSGGAIFLVVASTFQNNSIIFECTNSSGLMQNLVLRKNVGGTLTQLLSQAGASSTLGRRLQVGDEIELHVIGQRVHLFISGYRITAAAGADLDTGGAYTKGTICGFGTGQGTGAVFDDVYVAGIGGVVTIADTQAFWPGSLALGGRRASISGTYSGDVQAIDYRVVNASSGAVVKDWTRASGATVSAGAWSASVFVPMCNTTTTPKVRIQVRAANDVDVRALSSVTAVGMAVGSYGQSNSFYRSMVSATSHSVSNGYVYGQFNGGYWQGGGTTSTARSELWATKLSQAIGVPVGVFVGGSGSKSIDQLNVRGEGVLDEMEALCQSANAYGYIAAWLWTQGEAEALASTPFNESAYRTNFDTLLSELRGPIAVSSSAPVGICVIGRHTGVHISGATFGDANFTATRAGLYRLTDKAGVFIATHLTDGTLIDEIHYVADTYVENGRRVGMSMAVALGYGGINGRGPLITGATRSGATITLAVNLNGASSLSGTGLTHYQVSTDDFATLKAISSTEVSGSNIVITLSADPGAPVKVRSFYGMSWTSPVRAMGSYADGTSIPVEPIYTPLAQSA